jgi:hypothetical protein
MPDAQAKTQASPRDFINHPCTVCTLAKIHSTNIEEPTLFTYHLNFGGREKIADVIEAAEF